MSYNDAEIEVRDRLRFMRLAVNAAIRELDRKVPDATRFANARGHTLAIEALHANRVNECLDKLAKNALKEKARAYIPDGNKYP